MQTYLLVIRTTAAAPSPSLEFTQPSGKMAVDYAERVLSIYGRADWVMGGDLFSKDPEKHISSFETRTICRVTQTADS